MSVTAMARLLEEDPFAAAAFRLGDELARRVEALEAVGLGYVTLDRPVPSLSRGEGQRLRLAVALSSRLEDVLHILDEPTIGLHPADVQRVLPAFRRLAGPVLYVEHDRLAARFADRAVDLGPAAGPGGGRILYDGPPAGLLEADTPTGRAFRAGKARPRARAALPPPERFLRIRGAALHNLRHIDVEIPLSRLTAVTGVSGSGKSTLVQDVLVASLHSHRPVGCLSVNPPLGAPRALVVDQSPIGINPRSTPATYTAFRTISVTSLPTSPGWILPGSRSTDPKAPVRSVMAWAPWK